jgi:hypothetical protein
MLPPRGKGSGVHGAFLALSAAGIGGVSAEMVNIASHLALAARMGLVRAIANDNNFKIILLNGYKFTNLATAWLNSPNRQKMQSVS